MQVMFLVLIDILLHWDKYSDLTSSSNLFQVLDMSITDFEHIGQQYLQKVSSLILKVQRKNQAINRRALRTKNAYLSRFTISS